MSSIFFAGGPHTGKSTYLALLVLAITNQQHVSLRLGSFKDDREYAMELARALILCEPQQRTSVDERRGLRLSVTAPAGESDLLEVPDLSGEVWKELLTERTWTVQLRDAVRASSGVCVFANAATFADDPTIAEADRIRTALEPGYRAVDGTNAEFADDGPAGQLALVDLIQTLATQPGSPRRIALVISAFDSSGASVPRDWVAQCAPLVAQYIQSNSDRLQIRLYGLSAQGGNFDTDESRIALRKVNAVDRASLLDGAGSPVDLDEPIRWAMGIG